MLMLMTIERVASVFEDNFFFFFFVAVAVALSSRDYSGTPSLPA